MPTARHLCAARVAGACLSLTSAAWQTVMGY